MNKIQSANQHHHIFFGVTNCDCDLRVIGKRNEKEVLDQNVLTLLSGI